MKIVDGVLVPSSPADIAQRARDVADSVPLKAARDVQTARRNALFQPLDPQNTDLAQVARKINGILRLMRGADLD